MANLWNPSVVLGIQVDPLEDCYCAGRVQSLQGPPRRCKRVIATLQLVEVRGLLADMSTQMPDEIDHSTLLHLAQASLCTTRRHPRRGTQEAATIYRWTRLLAKEAGLLRAKSRTSLPANTSTGAPDRGLPSPQSIRPSPVLDHLPGSSEEHWEGHRHSSSSQHPFEPVQTEHDNWDTETVVPQPGYGVVCATMARTCISEHMQQSTILSRRRQKGGISALVPPTLSLVHSFSMSSIPGAILPPTPPHSALFFDDIPVILSAPTPATTTTALKNPGNDIPDLAAVHMDSQSVVPSFLGFDSMSPRNMALQAQDFVRTSRDDSSKASFTLLSLVQWTMCAIQVLAFLFVVFQKSPAERTSIGLVRG